jgi:cytochrome c peroxidase
VHDVGSAAKVDGRGAFDTPSLRGVGRTAPYFHDGRYATLRDLILGVDDTMGRTRHLSADDVDALTAYLESL